MGERDVSSHIASTPQEIAWKLAEQARIQQEKSVATRAQQQSIESLRLMVEFLVKSPTDDSGNVESIDPNPALRLKDQPEVTYRSSKIMNQL